MRINVIFLPVQLKSTGAEINPWNNISIKTHYLYSYITTKYDSLACLELQINCFVCC